MAEQEEVGGDEMPPPEGEGALHAEEWMAEPTGVDAATACVGGKLDEIEGASVGRVDGVLVDAVDGSPTWLLVRLGRFGKRAAVPFDYVAPGVGHAWTPFPRETIRAATELDPSGGLSCADERALSAHFGTPEGSGRAAAIADRGDDDPGSVPA